MEPVPVALGAKPEIACTLSPGDRPGRLADWEAVLAAVVSREAVPGGVRLGLAPDLPLGPIVELTAAEHECCRFFSFALTMDERGPALEVTAPPEAADLVAGLFGTP